MDPAITPACDAGPGKALGRRRNRTCEVVHRAAAAGARVKTRQRAEQRMFVRHERARPQPEGSQIHHTEIWQELRDRPALAGIRKISYRVRPSALSADCVKR